MQGVPPSQDQRGKTATQSSTMSSDAANMESALRGYSNGLTGAELAVLLFGAASETTKNKIHAIASGLKDSVVPAPNSGYKHARWATDDEFKGVKPFIPLAASKSVAVECKPNGQLEFQKSTR